MVRKLTPDTHHSFPSRNEPPGRFHGPGQATPAEQLEPLREGQDCFASGHPSGRCYSGDPFLRPSGSVTASVRPATAQPSTSTTKSQQAPRSKVTAKRKASVLEDGRSLLEDIGNHIARVRERGPCVTAVDDREGMDHFSIARQQSRSSQSTERKVAIRDAQGKRQISQILPSAVGSSSTSFATMQGPVKRQRRIGDCHPSRASKRPDDLLEGFFHAVLECTRILSSRIRVEVCYSKEKAQVRIRFR